jgi:hypothetical protein
MQSALPFDEIGTQYDGDFIRNNPIPACCLKCKRRFEGRDAIGAPTLEMCRCFYCGGNLRPIDKKAYAQRLIELPKYIVWQGFI